MFWIQEIDKNAQFSNDYRLMQFISFEPGRASDMLSCARSEDETNMFKSEYDYLRMDFASAENHLEHLFNSAGIAFRANAFRLHAATMVMLGKFDKFDESVDNLVQIQPCGYGGLDVRVSQLALNMSFICGGKDNQVSALLRHDMSGLCPGYRLYIFFMIKAMQLFVNGEFDKLIHISQTIDILEPEHSYPVQCGSFACICAIAAANIKDYDEMDRQIQLACRLLKPDDFMAPFVSRALFFNERLIAALEKYWPDCALVLRNTRTGYSANRIEAHNRLAGDIVAKCLSKREYEVASLAVRGLRNKEISEELGISANTVRTILYNVFNKLNIEKRKDLQDFVYGLNTQTITRKN